VFKNNLDVINHRKKGLQDWLNALVGNAELKGEEELLLFLEGGASKVHGGGPQSLTALALAESRKLVSNAFDLYSS